MFFEMANVKQSSNYSLNSTWPGLYAAFQSRCNAIKTIDNEMTCVPGVYAHIMRQTF